MPPKAPAPARTGARAAARPGWSTCSSPPGRCGLPGLRVQLHIILRHSVVPRPTPRPYRFVLYRLDPFKSRAKRSPTDTDPAETSAIRWDRMPDVRAWLNASQARVGSPARRQSRFEVRCPSSGSAVPQSERFRHGFRVRETKTLDLLDFIHLTYAFSEEPYTTWRTAAANTARDEPREDCACGLSTVRCRVCIMWSCG